MPPRPVIGRLVADGSDARWRAAAFAFCALMAGVHIAAGLQAAGVEDFWRDMYWATSIAHGDAFPLSGPPIYGLTELGPWWYYVVALPIFATGRIAVAAAFIQLLVAMKYVIAFRIGSRAIDARFGFACSIGLAIAGWSTLPVLFMTHTAITETMLLLLAAATWRCWSTWSFGSAILFGLACAGSLHAHPSTLAYVVIAGAALLYRHRSLRGWALMGAAGVVIALSIVPPLLDPAARLATAKSAAAYLGNDVGVNVLARLPRLLNSLTFGGVEVCFVILTRWNAGAVHVAVSLYRACLFVVAAGALHVAWRRPTWRRPLLLAIALFVTQAGFLVVLRPVTPMWMAPSALPPLAAALAIGWYGVFTAPRPAWRVIGGVALAFYIALGIVPFGMLLHDLHSVRVMANANPLFDIIQRDAATNTIEVPFLSVSNVDRLGPLLCAPGVLHARLATVIQNSLGTSIRNACGHWPTLRYGGVDGEGPHRAGLFVHAAEMAGIAPDRIAAGVAWYDHIRAIAPAEGGWPTRLHRAQVNVDAPWSPLLRHEFVFRAAPGDRIVLTNRTPVTPMKVVAVQADGRAATLRYDDVSSRVYACDACQSTPDNSWTVEVDAVEANLDLIVIEAQPEQ